MALWSRIRIRLEDAARALQEHCDPDSLAKCLGEYRASLEQNELELALDALEEGLQEGCPGRDVPSACWSLLADCAELMKLADRAERLRDPARAVAAPQREGSRLYRNKLRLIEAALAELAAPQLAITRQFLAVHELAESPVALSEIRDQRGSVWIRIAGHPYWWVVQGRQEGEGWQIDWGYCSPRTRVYLAIYSQTLDPDRISGHLGLQPTEIRFRGTAISPRTPQRSHGEHRWYLASPSAQPLDWQSKLTALLEALQPVRNQLRELPADCSRQLRIVLEEYSEYPSGIQLSRSRLAELANLGLDLDVDRYCSGPPLPDE